jgi:hypothetical protein
MPKMQCRAKQPRTDEQHYQTANTKNLLRVNKIDKPKNHPGGKAKAKTGNRRKENN